MRLPRLDDPTQLADLDPKPTWRSFIEDYSRGDDSKPAKPENPFLAVPIASGSEVFGAVRVRRSTDRPFTVQDQWTLEGYCRRLGQAIDEHRAKRRERIKFDLTRRG